MRDLINVRESFIKKQIEDDEAISIKQDNNRIGGLMMMMAGINPDQ